MGAMLLAVGGTLLAVVILLLLIPTCVLLVQVLSAKPALSTKVTDDMLRPRLAVLIPAHNESAGIDAAVRSVLSQLQPGDRVLVVADNCDDNTAALAAAAGAEVAQRLDPMRRGKGYALDFGVRHLQIAPPDVVVIVDADCMLGPDCIALLSGECLRTQRPVQALDLMQALPGAGLKTRLAELAWVVKNEVRPLGFWQLGFPCQLMGTGMAFPWKLIHTAPLASGNIVEDLELGLVLAGAGTPPLFCPGARVTSTFPAGAADLATQRTRWEHGHVGVIASQAPRLLWRAMSQRNPMLLAIVLDLCVPPLASLALLLSAGAFFGVVLVALGGSPLPFLLAATTTALFTTAVLCAWRRFGRNIVSGRELLSVPAYVLAKIPIYAGLFKGRQAEWVRTKRDDGRR